MMLRASLFTAALVAVATATAPGAHAQRRDPDAEVSLARVAASECGLLCADEEVAAIASVLRARCPRCTLTTVARLYSSRVFDPSRRDTRAWVAHLRRDARQPSMWPASARWENHRANWERLLDVAARVVRGELGDSCGEEVHHWGARYGVDMERARRAGWREVDCTSGEEPTRNAFWSVIPIEVD